MWNPFSQPKQAGTTVVLTLSGLHCTNCALTIDTELEELPGVHASNTHYAKGRTTVTFDPAQQSIQSLTQVVEALGYTVSEGTQK